MVPHTIKHTAIVQTMLQITENLTIVQNELKLLNKNSIDIIEEIKKDLNLHKISNE